MSDAVEGADVMLYGVCLSYKESGNCRLECNYGTKVKMSAYMYISLHRQVAKSES